MASTVVAGRNILRLLDCDDGTNFRQEKLITMTKSPRGIATAFCTAACAATVLLPACSGTSSQSSNRSPAASGGNAAPSYATGEWWNTPSQGKAVCGMVKVGGRDWVVNYGIGDMNGTAEGARMVDTLIKEYCPQYAR